MHRNKLLLFFLFYLVGVISSQTKEHGEPRRDARSLCVHVDKQTEFLLSLSYFCKLTSFDQYLEFCQCELSLGWKTFPLFSPKCLCQHDTWLSPLLAWGALSALAPRLIQPCFLPHHRSSIFTSSSQGGKFFTVSVPKMGCISRYCHKF